MFTKMIVIDYYYYNSNKTIFNNLEKIIAQIDMKENIDLEKMIQKIWMRFDVQLSIVYWKMKMIDINLIYP